MRKSVTKLTKADAVRGLAVSLGAGEYLVADVGDTVETLRAAFPGKTILVWAHVQSLGRSTWLRAPEPDETPPTA